jgi:hypothetical protein
MWRLLGSFVFESAAKMAYASAAKKINKASMIFVDFSGSPCLIVFRQKII